MKYEEFIVTQGWLDDMGACEAGLQAFKKHFPNGGEALEVLKRCEEINHIGYARWLVEYLPLTYPSLEFNTFVGNLLYPGDVHIKGDLSIQELTYIKEGLKIDGKLTVNNQQSVLAAFVNADDIDVSGESDIHARIKANSISMSDYAFIRGAIVANSISLRDFVEILGTVKAKVVNLKGGYISDDVDADEIINDGGLIDGNVNTIKIQNLNGGRVAGKITYKRSDEHK